MYKKEKDMSIQAVSFGKTVTTKKGNEYKKTHAGTITGAALGLAATGINVYKLNKLRKTSVIKRMIGGMYSTYKAKAKMPKLQAAKAAKRTAKASVALYIAIPLLGYFGLGALVNKAVNHYRAKAADKAAAQAEKPAETKTEKPETETV